MPSGPTGVFVMHPNNLGPVQIASSSATYPQQVKFFDRSTPGTYPINQWSWKFGDTYTWIPDGALNDTWVDISSASTTIFQVDQRVWFTTSGGGSLPGALSTTVMYWVKTVATVGIYTVITVSLTQGGAAVVVNGGGSGTFYVQHGSAEQNPIFEYQHVGNPTSRNVTFTVTDVAGNSNAPTNTFYQQSSLITKPAATAYNKTISIFVCTPPIAGTQSACIINRVRSPNNGLFFTDFQCVGAISKAGTLNFTVVDLGLSDAGTVAARALIKQANNWVVVVVGYQVVWSGQILRTIDNNTQIYTGTTAYTQYAVQCESDIGKMKSQYVKDSAQTTVKGTTGTIISQLVQANLTTDINWNGTVESSIISREGNAIQYTITAQNMYDQFIAIANSTGFDWRTRMQYYKQTYNTFNGSTSLVFSGFGSYYSTNSFQNKWVLFVVPTYKVVTLAYTSGNGTGMAAGDAVSETSGTVVGIILSVTLTSGTWGAGTAAGTIQIMTNQTWTTGTLTDATTSATATIASITSTVTVSNNTGIFSFARCTSNTTTTLTLTGAQNANMVPAASGRAIILVGSVLDYAWSLETPQPMVTILSNASSDSGAFQGQYFSDNSDYKSLATVVTVKGKSIVPSQGTGIGSTITATLYAKDQWDGTYNFFKKTAFVTQRMDGYVYAYGVGNAYIDLIGQGYALQVNDNFQINYILSDGTTGLTSGFHVHAVATRTESDGTPTTRITANVVIDAANSYMKYSKFIAWKTYLNDPDWLTNSYPGTCYVGSTGERQFQASYTGLSADATYGNYVTVTATGQVGTDPIPALPGTLVSLNLNTPTDPDEDSPLARQNNGMPLLKSKTVDQNITQSDLDVYASMLLVNLSYYLRKANVTAKFIMDYQTGDWRDSLQNFDPGMVREGELICVLPSSSVAPTYDAKFADGQYKYRWQVISWTLDGSTIQVKVELGDYEKNTYTLLNQDTASINQTLT